MEENEILLHICCGPCSLYCIDHLREKYPGINIHGLYANPNIHPYDEFIRRKESTEAACRYKNIDVSFLDDFDQESWENFCTSDGSEQIQGEPHPERCLMCYERRMELTARECSKRGMKYFTSTLFVSPYQNHEMLRNVCMEKAGKYNIEFIYEDFRVGFRKGQQEAREIGLYRQKYCGCIRSLRPGKGGKENGK